MPDFPLIPEQASRLAQEVDLLTAAWVVVSLFFGTLITVLVLYFFVRFRRRKEGEVGIPEQASWPLELTWSLIPLAIALAMFFWGAKVFFAISRPPADAVEFQVTGKQWMWKIQHPSGQREINDLHVPVNTPIKLNMTSEDVIHSFYLPAFRVKQDVLPGRYTTVWFEADKPGEYHIFCTEYCGAEHSKMIGTIHVLEQDEYEAWIGGGPPSKPPAEMGQELFAQLACDTCHITGRESRGPELENLYGGEVRLTTGRTVAADDTYLRESILNPAAKVVAGFQPLMPTYQGQVSEEQLSHLLAFIKSLSKREPADAEAPAPAEETATSQEG